MPVDKFYDADSNAVLVLGRDIRAFLSVIRSFGRSNLLVHVGMCTPDDLALKSKYVHKYHDIPEYSPNSSEWIDRITQLVGDYGFKLIVPTHDESAIPIQIYRDQLSEICAVYQLNPETFGIAFDKIKSSQLAADLGVNVPKQLTISIEKLNGKLPAEFHFPIVVKPASSYTADDLSQRREVMIVKSSNQLADVIERHKDWGEILIQEIFQGVGVGVEVLANAGNILAIFQHERVHEPLNGGASSYRKSVPLNPELQDATQKLIGALNYTGVAMVEYKLNRENGTWIFIEINGRFWGSLPLAIASKVDFPFYLYDLLVNNNSQSRPRGKIHVYCRNLRRDLYWNIDNLKERLAPNPAKGSTPLSIVALEFLRLFTFRDHIDSFTIDDPKPGLAEFREIGSMVVAKGNSFLKRRIRNATFVKKLTAQRIKGIVHSSRQILFVCSGNICRSPFAEIYAKSILPRVISVRSCGFIEKNKPKIAAPSNRICEKMAR